MVIHGWQLHRRRGIFDASSQRQRRPRKTVEELKDIRLVGLGNGSTAVFSHPGDVLVAPADRDIDRRIVWTELGTVVEHVHECLIEADRFCLEHGLDFVRA